MPTPYILLFPRSPFLIFFPILCPFSGKIIHSQGLSFYSHIDDSAIWPGHNPLLKSGPINSIACWHITGYHRGTEIFMGTKLTLFFSNHQPKEVPIMFPLGHDLILLPGRHLWSFLLVLPCPLSDSALQIQSPSPLLNTTSLL